MNPQPRPKKKIAPQEKSWYDKARDAYESPAMAAAQLADPSGVITGWPGVLFSGVDMYNDPSWNNAGNLASSIIGSLPLLGKVRAAATLGRVAGGLAKTEKIVDKVSSAIRYIPELPVKSLANSNIPVLKGGSQKLIDLGDDIGNAITNKIGVNSSVATTGNQLAKTRGYNIAADALDIMNLNFDAANLKEQINASRKKKAEKKYIDNSVRALKAMDSNIRNEVEISSAINSMRNVENTENKHYGDVVELEEAINRVNRNEDSRINDSVINNINITQQILEDMPRIIPQQRQGFLENLQPRRYSYGGSVQRFDNGGELDEIVINVPRRKNKGLPVENEDITKVVNKKEPMKKTVEKKGVNKPKINEKGNKTIEYNGKVIEFIGRPKEIEKPEIPDYLDEDIELPKYEFGTYIENPQMAIQRNNQAMAKASQAANSHFGANLMGGIGNAMIQKGIPMLTGGITNSLAGMDTNSGFGNFMKGNAGFFGNLAGNAMQYGASNMQQFDNGGMVGQNIPVEVEGNEVGQMPNGQMLDFQGPSHEQGGIPVALPEGTEIYSNRVKVDGVSMANRKKKREKRTLTLEQLFEKSKNDALLKNALTRTQQSNQIEEDADNKIQQTVKQLLEGQQPIPPNSQGMPMEGMQPQQFSVGGPVPGRLNPAKLKAFHDQIGINPSNKGYGTTFGPMSQKAYATGNYEPVWDKTEPVSRLNSVAKAGDVYQPMSNDIFNRFSQFNPMNMMPSTVGGSNDMGGFNFLAEPSYPNINNSYNSPLYNKSVLASTNSTPENTLGAEAKKPFDLSSYFGDTTTGDIMTIAGNHYQGDKIMDMIKENRAMDTPNINAYKNFGQDALKSIDKSKSYLRGQEAAALQNLELSRTASINRNRNSARGINTMRGLDFATDAMINGKQNEIYNTTASAMSGILNTQAQMENQRDSHVMQGDQARDLADRQDIDNFYTQMIQGYKNKGMVMSQTGKDLNDMKLNRVKSKLTNNMADYYYTDSNGVTRIKPEFDGTNRNVRYNESSITNRNNLDSMSSEDLMYAYKQAQQREDYARKVQAANTANKNKGKK